MPLSEGQKKALAAAVIIGGSVTAAALVSKALAKPPSVTCSVDSDCPPGLVCDNGRCVQPKACSVDSDCPFGYVCVNGKCVLSTTGLPADIVPTSYPTTLTQLYGIFGNSSPQGIYLSAEPLINFSYPPFTSGLNYQVVTFKVEDGLKKGIPGKKVECWTNTTLDDQGGQLQINNMVANSDSPATAITDANGEASFLLSYVMVNFKTLTDIHKIGCCISLYVLGKLLVNPGPLSIWQGCGPPGFPCWKVRDAQTAGRVYVVYAALAGTTMATQTSISCMAKSECTWT